MPSINYKNIITTKRKHEKINETIVLFMASANEKTNVDAKVSHIKCRSCVCER